MIIKNIGNETMRYSGIYSIILKPNEERDFPPEIGQRLLATMPNLIETGNFVYKEDNKRYLGHLSAYNTYYGYGVGGLA